MKVQLSEPGVAGSYVVEEERPDGRLLLAPLDVDDLEGEGKVFESVDDLFEDLDAHSKQA